jgi:hypothetical protein
MSGRLKIIQDDGSKEVVSYLSDIQPLADDLDNLIDNVDSLAGTGRTTETVKGNADDIIDLTEEVGSNKEEFDELKEKVVKHKLDYMPHRFQDIKNNKIYNFGFQLSAEGNPQIIYEEVIE